MAIICLDIQGFARGRFDRARMQKFSTRSSRTTSNHSHFVSMSPTTIKSPSSSCVSYYQLGLDTISTHNQSKAIEDRYFPAVGPCQRVIYLRTFWSTQGPVRFPFDLESSLWPAPNVTLGSYPNEGLISWHKMLHHDRKSS